MSLVLYNIFDQSCPSPICFKTIDMWKLPIFQEIEVLIHTIRSMQYTALLSNIISVSAGVPKYFVVVMYLFVIYDSTFSICIFLILLWKLYFHLSLNLKYLLMYTYPITSASVLTFLDLYLYGQVYLRV